MSISATAHSTATVLGYEGKGRRREISLGKSRPQKLHGSLSSLFPQSHLNDWFGASATQMIPEHTTTRPDVVLFSQMTIAGVLV